MPPLPDGWREYRTTEGRPFFFNSLTYKSTYIRPGDENKNVTGKPEWPVKRVDIGKTGWSRMITNKQHVFYWRAETRTSSWSVPEPVADAVDKMDYAGLAAYYEEPQESRDVPQKVVHSVKDLESLSEYEPAPEPALEDVEGQGQEARGPTQFLDNDAARETMFRILDKYPIKPLMPYEMEKRKFESDSALDLIDPGAAQDIFNEYCKALLQRQKREKSLQSPLEGYRSLLRETVRHKMAFIDFQEAWSQDPRFNRAGLQQKEREYEFRLWIHHLETRGDRDVVARDFKAMLTQRCSSDAIDKEWPQVKEGLQRDPRYLAVKSSAKRESLFKDWKKDKLEEKQKKAEEKKNMSAHVHEQSASALRKMRRHQQIADLESLLINASENISVEVLCERFPELHASEVRAALDRHAEAASSRLSRTVNNILSASVQHDENRLLVSFADVYDRIKDHAVIRQLEQGACRDLFESWKRKMWEAARQDFTLMLDQLTLLQHWGRVQKMAEAGEFVGIQYEQDQGEKSDEEKEVDLVKQAKHVTPEYIASLVESDPRYKVFHFMPEERHSWIKEYMARM